MQYFGSNIRIEGDSLAVLAIEVLGWEQEKMALAVADKYEKQVLKLLTMIKQKGTGKALHQALSQLWSKTMTIKPEIEQFSIGEVNAEAVPESGRDAIKKGKPIWLDTAVGAMLAGKGTGFGSNTTIYITPNQWISDNIKQTLLGMESYEGILADDILVHEMVHGLRQMSGVDYHKPVPFQKTIVEGKKVNCYPNIEEWFAVLVQNIYRSECKKDLRIDYGTTLGNFSDREFIRLGMNRFHLRQLRREHKGFFSELRDVSAAFNPTRLLLDI